MTITPDYIANHVERALGDLVTMLGGRPVIEALVRALGEEVQELEDATWACVADRLLSTAVGTQLDAWGEIVGEQRGGLNDLEYRAFIEARILSNLSEGEPDRMARILSVLVGGVPVRYVPLYPAAMFFQYVRPAWTSARHRARVVAQMVEVAPAGVSVDHITEAIDGYFGFDDDDDALGFDEGLWPEVIE